MEKSRYQNWHQTQTSRKAKIQLYASRSALLPDSRQVSTQTSFWVSVSWPSLQVSSLPCCHSATAAPRYNRGGFQTDPLPTFQICCIVDSRGDMLSIVEASACLSLQTCCREHWIS